MSISVTRGDRGARHGGRAHELLHLGLHHEHGLADVAKLRHRGCQGAVDGGAQHDHHHPAHGRPAQVDGHVCLPPVDPCSHVLSSASAAVGEKLTCSTSESYMTRAMCATCFMACWPSSRSISPLTS